MEIFELYAQAIAANWVVWAVSVILIVAAVIDGFQLKVPNWLTYPFIISGWVISFCLFGWAGLGWSMLGTLVGLALLMPAYAIGGMGAGDVKLMAGIGAWMHVEVTFYSFCLSAVIGALLAVAMVLYRKAWSKHKHQFFAIITEIMTVKDPNELSAIAADRKSTMLLLPYGIPIAIGTIGYFLLMGMLV